MITAKYLKYKRNKFISNADSYKSSFRLQNHHALSRFDTGPHQDTVWKYLGS